MKVTAHRTRLIKSGDSIEEVLAESLPPLKENSFVVIASKIFSTCEGRFIQRTEHNPGEKFEKHELARQEAEWYLEPHSSKYNLMLTVKRNWMFVNAGIDESNADGAYLLWPKDPQTSINKVWQFLRAKNGIQNLGVTMSDSASFPLNWGVIGHSIAYCGFNPLKSYIGKPDLFGRTMVMEQVNMAASVTAAAVLEMGEGAERTPFAVVEEVTGAEFQDHEPTAAELQSVSIELADDAFAPILTKADWKKGGGGII